MPRLRPLLAGIALALLACLGTGAAATARPPAAAQPAGKQLAMAAGAFTDSVGVNVAPGDAAAGWAIAQRLEAAGIRHVRGPAATGPDDPALEGLRALAGADLRLDLVMGADADPAPTSSAPATEPCRSPRSTWARTCRPRWRPGTCRGCCWPTPGWPSAPTSRAAAPMALDPACSTRPAPRPRPTTPWPVCSPCSTTAPSSPRRATSASG